jgi:hypothetical protein
MKSVGEVMGLGRTFGEALMKALASLEGGPKDAHDWTDDRSAGALSPAGRSVLRDPRSVPARLGSLRAPRAHTDRRVVPPPAPEPRRGGEPARRALPQHDLGLGNPPGQARGDHRQASLAVARDGRGARSRATPRRKDPAGVQARRHVRGGAQSSTPPSRTSRGRGAQPTDRVIILGTARTESAGPEFDYCCCHARSASARPRA